MEGVDVAASEHNEQLREAEEMRDGMKEVNDVSNAIAEHVDADDKKQQETSDNIIIGLEATDKTNEDLGAVPLPPPSCFY